MPQLQTHNCHMCKYVQFICFHGNRTITTQHTLSVTSYLLFMWDKWKVVATLNIKCTGWFMVSKHTFAYCIASETMLQMYAIITITVRQPTARQQATNVSVSNTWHEAQLQSWNKSPEAKTEVTHGHSVRDCWHGLQEGCGDDSLSYWTVTW
jgi:hypothetical protein